MRSSRSWVGLRKSCSTPLQLCSFSSHWRASQRCDDVKKRHFFSVLSVRRQCWPELISNIQPVASLQVSASQLCLHFELILIFLSTLSLQNSACVYQVVLFHWEEPESVHVDWRDKYVLIQEKTFKIADTKWPAETDSNGKAWWIWSHSDCGWWAPTVHILWVFVAVWSFNAICRAEGSSLLRCLCPHRKPWTTASGHP